MGAPRFGDRLREIRVANRIPLREIARKMDISAPYLSDVELNRRNPPSEEKIRRLADLLAVDPKELLDLAEKEKRRVQLQLSHERPAQLQAGLSLARQWDDLSDDALNEIEKILTGQRDRR